MKQLRVCIALVLGLPTGPLRAQDTTALAPGARVRVLTMPDPCEFTGPSCPFR